MFTDDTPLRYALNKMAYFMTPGQQGEGGKTETKFLLMKKLCYKGGLIPRAKTPKSFEAPQAPPLVLGKHYVCCGQHYTWCGRHFARYDQHLEQFQKKNK